MITKKQGKQAGNITLRPEKKVNVLTKIPLTDQVMLSISQNQQTFIFNIM